jgi:predicted nucleotidyltransferase
MELIREELRYLINILVLLERRERRVEGILLFGEVVRRGETD